jgi:hypothetical protein
LAARHLADVEVALARLAAAEVHGVRRAAHVQRGAVGVGVDGDGLDAHLLGGADHAQGDLAAVGDQDASEHAAGVLDLAPEWVYAVAGSVFALLLSLLLFLTVRWFLPGGRGVWWVFLAILLGGGLGGHLKVLNQWAAVREGGILGRVVGAVNDAPVFESYRSHYLFKSLFDSHFLLLWLLTLASLLAFYFALRRFSVGRAALAAGLCGLITLLHVYEAFTLAAVFAMVVFLCFRRGQATGAALRTAAACCAAMGSVLVALFLVQRSSGLPLPDWTPEEMPFASLALAFPLAWLAITFGFGRWWPHAGLEGCFLMGWLLGSVLLSLSGPYFPYADRAPMALAIPVWILAGLIWHRERERLGAAQGLCPGGGARGLPRL